VKSIGDIVEGYVTKAAEQMPEAKYSYQPTKEVRTFGQLIGHIADSNYFFCGTAKGEKAPEPGAEKMTKKADLQKALAESFAYCDAVYASLNDTTGAAPVKVEGMDETKLSTMSFNTAHDFEHYGNIVTYLRLNKMVPPSSQPATPAPGK
jgi:uncharacterized damage-inducible protein DinB